MDERHSDLNKMLKRGEFNEALPLVKNPWDKDESCMFVIHVLDCPEVPHALLDASLEAFVNIRKVNEHPYWVNCISAFIERLWSRENIRWIRRLHEISFSEARRLNRTHGCARLVRAFMVMSHFSHNPADFFITREVVSWMEDTPMKGYATKRIEKDSFASKRDFLSWEIRETVESRMIFNFDVQYYVVDVAYLQKLIEELIDLGEDPHQFETLIRIHVTNYREDLETQLNDAELNDQYEYIGRALRYTHEQLANL